MKFPIGKIGLVTCFLELAKLIKGKLLAAASSGGGKSNLIFVLAEALHGKIPVIIFDREGEYSPLREKCGSFILFGPDGDMPVHVGAAKLLMLRLIEENASAIIDISEMPVHEMHQFMKICFETLINAPKNIWGPRVVVVDEAHEFAPENGEGSSVAKNAFIELSSKCRKRWIGLVLATQRAAKLDKSVISECRNLMVGFLNRHDDRKQLGKELGFSTKEELMSMRTLEEGEFWVQGPAIHKEVVRVQLPLAATHRHHEMKKIRKSAKTSAPTARVLKLLEKLKDLPKEAAQEMKTLEEMKTRIKELEQKLRTVPATPKPVVERIVEKINVDAIRREIAVAYRVSIKEWQEKVVEKVNRLAGEVGAYKNDWVPPFVDVKTISNSLRTISPAKGDIVFRSMDAPRRSAGVTSIRGQLVPTITIDENEKPLGGSEGKILGFLLLHPNKSFKKSQIRAMIKMKVAGGSFRTYISRLKSRGFIEGDDLFKITEAGIQAAASLGIEPPADLKSGLEGWLEKLPGNQKAIYEVLLTKPGHVFSVEELSELSGLQCSGGSFRTYISRLCTVGLAVRNKEGVQLNPEIQNL